MLKAKVVGLGESFRPQTCRGIEKTNLPADVRPFATFDTKLWQCAWHSIRNQRSPVEILLQHDSVDKQESTYQILRPRVFLIPILDPSCHQGD